MKKYFFTGLIVLLPVTITMAVFLFLLDVLTTPFLGYMEMFLEFINQFLPFEVGDHKQLFIFLSKILVLATLFVIVLLLGFMGQKLFFHWIVKKINHLFLRIPLFKTIFKVIHDIVTAVFADRQKFFEKIVIAPFPFDGAKMVGLVPGDAPESAQVPGASPEKRLKTCFLPTAPHPFSGFLLLLEDSLLENLDVNLEEVLKFIISCGIYQPPGLSGRDK
ncbi:MAG: DUF502 domain-containing protein [Chlamydiae bacterium]|nr:DUF502 domain-containing protein [Chlamydiota bacterium]